MKEKIYLFHITISFYSLNEVCNLPQACSVINVTIFYNRDPIPLEKFVESFSSIDDLDMSYLSL